MPTLEELDTLKNRINELGDEPRLLAERGEKLHDVAPPEARTDADLEQLLDDDFAGGGIDEMEALLGTYTDDLDDLEPPDELNLDDLTRRKRLTRNQYLKKSPEMSLSMSLGLRTRMPLLKPRRRPRRGPPLRRRSRPSRKLTISERISP
jgi:hypothetical protein